LTENPRVGSSILSLGTILKSSVGVLPELFGFCRYYDKKRVVRITDLLENYNVTESPFNISKKEFLRFL